MLYFRRARRKNGEHKYPQEFVGGFVNTSPPQIKLRVVHAMALEMEAIGQDYPDPCKHISPFRAGDFVGPKATIYLTPIEAREMALILLDFADNKQWPSDKPGLSKE